MSIPKAYKTNKLATHLAYPKIMLQYNEWLKRDLKVNNKKFWEEVIRKEIPSYSLISWYKFLNKFKSDIGLKEVEVMPHPGNPNLAPVAIAEGEVALAMLSNQEALQVSIAAAMNISAAALKEIMENPELIPAEKRAELFLKVMKAQDSRVKAIGTIRADNRDQERFERAMDSAAFD
jgi:hypothetical protein